MIFDFKRLSVFEEKKLNLSDLGQSSMNDLDLCCHKSFCTHLFDYMYQLSPQKLQ